MKDFFLLLRAAFHLFFASQRSALVLNVAEVS